MDAFQVYGGDLSLNASNTDIAVATDFVEGRQRVIRRILTFPTNYIFDPTYGGGAPELIGTTTQPKTVEATMLAQMLQEQAVSQNPPPSVVVTQPVINTTQVNISYTDAQTGDGVLLGVSLTP